MSTGDTAAPVDLARLCGAPIDHAPMAMAALLGDVVRHVNPAFCRLLQRSPAQLVGRSFCALMPDADACAARLESVHRTGRASSVTGSATPEHTSWTYTFWPMIADGRELAILAQVVETTTLQERTIAMNEALVLGAVRQHELIEAAEVATGRLRDVDRHRVEFLAMLGHELRNPLAPIRYTLDVIQHAGSDAKLIGRALRVMERQVRYMGRLIDDLLDMGRISHGKLNLRLEEVELATVVHDAVETATALAEASHHELSVTLPPEPVQLRADPARLAQVFGNLLNNACKFTPPGGRISLVATREGSDAVVTVTDSGQGIAPNLLPDIFEMFTQADQSLERAQGGLGVGLTLVRQLVTMHGGSVQASSAGLNQGSTFTVRLPTYRRTSAPAPPIDDAKLVAGRRILVVDDNRDAAHMLCLVLQLAGNDTQVAFDGAEAIAAAERYRPDVILMDIGMPNVNGYDAARQIRLQPWGKDIVLVALTGRGQEDDRKRSAEAGFNGHLLKPVERRVLARLLAEIPAKSRATRD